MSGATRIKYTLKVVIAHLLYYLGILQLWQMVVMRRKAVVLMYHRVLTPEERRRSGSHPALIVDRDSFAKQMAALKRRFRVLSVEEFADYLERRVPFPSRSCVITFDDGWRDNFTNALPILAEHELPALVFLPVNYIGRPRLFWQEALAHLLVQSVLAVRTDASRAPRLRKLLAPAGLEEILNIGDDDPRPSIVAAIADRKSLSRAVVAEVVTGIAAELAVNVDDLSATDGFIDWAQADAMSQRRVAFGGHGAEHLLLTQVSRPEAEAEIRVSKDVLDRRLKQWVPTFSYPNGYWTSDIAEMVRAAGYRLAFITRRGFVSCDDDPFKIRRINVQENLAASTPMLLARILGLWGRHAPAEAQ